MCRDGQRRKEAQGTDQEELAEDPIGGPLDCARQQMEIHRREQRRNFGRQHHLRSVGSEYLWRRNGPGANRPVFRRLTTLDRQRHAERRSLSTGQRQPGSDLSNVCPKRCTAVRRPVLVMGG